MKLNFLMDINEKSISLGHTPVTQYQHLPFYTVGCGHFYAGGSYYTEREGLDNYLLIYTLSGSGSLKFKNTEYIVGPNQAVVFHCTEYHYYKTASEIPWDFKWIHLNGASIKDYYEIINGDALNVVTMGENSKINEMMDTICNLINTKEMLLDIKICTILVNILSEIITCRHSPLNNRKYSQHKAEIDKVVNFISANYEKKISTDDITELVLISKFHFLRLFKAYTSLSPYEYLINYRVNMSKTLLRDTDLNIGEISSRVGFGDANNFIRYFKRLTGTTPANYRKYWIG